MSEQMVLMPTFFFNSSVMAPTFFNSSVMAPVPHFSHDLRDNRANDARWQWNTSSAGQECPQHS
jgi:hypothetical protein